MARKANLLNKKIDLSPSQQLARRLTNDDTDLSITKTEQALFAACFGQIIELIVSEPD